MTKTIYYYILLFIFIKIFLSTLSCTDSDDGAIKVEAGGKAPEGYIGPITKILEDNVHSTLQDTTLRLNETNFQYSKMYRYFRLFEQLNQNGYEHNRLTNGTLTPSLLENYDIMFLNLMDDSRPDFTEEEIEAVRAFVFNGGGLFVIADHTNVYRHAEMTNPLLAPFEIEIRYESCLDVYPHSISGLGWIILSDLTQHPVNEGLFEYSFQTGGPIDGPNPIAFTSEAGWGDKWDPEMLDGYYGNWVKDPDEQSGPQGVVQAVEYGEGRVVVVGDQNIFGDPYLLSFNNFGLAKNAFEWLAKRENETPALRSRKMPGFNIRVDAASCSLCTAKTAPEEYFTFYTNLNRVSSISAFATRQPLKHTPDALMWINPSKEITQDVFDEAEDVLNSGGQVFIFISSEDIPQQALEIFQHFLLPTVFQTANETAIDLSQNPKMDKLQTVTIAESSLNKKISLSECPDFQCSQLSLLSANDKDGNTCDLLCEIPFLNGRIILSPLGEYFQNQHLGGAHDVPEGQKENLFQLQLLLLDILQAY